mmetsp:Transcript_38196/g.107927  ORF Transcript_38196/g.107927 Transcript_38196/m.107927 type:complete len:624 (-) Transcript_38196:107-1978(-)
MQAAEEPTLEQRLDSVFYALQDAIAAGQRPDLEACQQELDSCMEDVKELLMEPMHTEREWVKGLAGIRGQLKHLLQEIDYLMRSGGKLSRTSILDCMHTTVEIMLDRIRSLEKERQRVKTAVRRTGTRSEEESCTARRARYERELYMYSLVDAPKRWTPGSGGKKGQKRTKIPAKIMALLKPPEENGDNSMAMVIANETDEYERTLQNTPLKRMKEKELLAAELRKEGQLDEEVRARQELVALARLHCQFEKGIVDTTALARAHINLGGAYASKGLWKQAVIHGRRGLDHVGMLPAETPNLTPVEQGAHALLGEAYMNLEQPSPDKAMAHLAKAFPDDGTADMSPVLALKLSECHAVMGEDAAGMVLQAGRNIRKGTSEIQKLVQKIASLDPTDMKRFQLQDRLYVLRPAIASAEREMPELCSVAETNLDKAVDGLMDYIDRYERAIEKRGGTPDRNSRELMMLYRRCSELMLQLAEVKQTQGSLNNSISLLEEIVRLHRVYGNLSSDLLATTHTLKGNALVKTGQMEEALDAYTELLSIQQSQDDMDANLRERGEGEAHKLMGNVYMAVRNVSSAEKHYSEALNLFKSAYGEGHRQTQELEKRIQRLAAFTSAHENSMLEDR